MILNSVQYDKKMFDIEHRNLEKVSRKLYKGVFTFGTHLDAIFLKKE